MCQPGLDCVKESNAVLDKVLKEIKEVSIKSVLFSGKRMDLVAWGEKFLAGAKCKEGHKEVLLVGKLETPRRMMK
jgi:hypothetical protein